MVLPGPFLLLQVRIYEPGLEEEWGRNGGVVHRATCSSSNIPGGRSGRGPPYRLFGKCRHPQHRALPHVAEPSSAPHDYPSDTSCPRVAMLCNGQCSPSALPSLPPLASAASQAHSSAGNQQGMVPWSSWLRVPRSGFATFGTHGGPSLVTYFDSVENLFNTQELSVTKPASHPSPTHYTFGVVSNTDANHTEELEELDSCERLHNVWYASSSAFRLSSPTAMERMSGYNFFPLSLSSPGLINILGVTIPRYDSLKAQTPTTAHPLRFVCTASARGCPEDYFSDRVSNAIACIPFSF